MVCKKCGHTTITEHGVEKCLSCGTEVVSVVVRKHFIEANLPEILKDIEELGSKKTHEKWGIAKSKLWQLRKDHLKTAAPPAPMSATAPGKNGLPPLPAFDNSWDEAVKIKWLEVWAGSQH